MLKNPDDGAEIDPIVVFSANFRSSWSEHAVFTGSTDKTEKELDSWLVEEAKGKEDESLPSEPRKLMHPTGWTSNGDSFPEGNV